MKIGSTIPGIQNKRILEKTEKPNYFFEVGIIHQRGGLPIKMNLCGV
jgi:hypothetical protein